MPHTAKPRTMADLARRFDGDIEKAREAIGKRWSKACLDNVCLICGAKLKEADRKKHEVDFCRSGKRPTCGKVCTDFYNQLYHHACCFKAKPRACVCYASFECPDHGVQCHGSHD